MNELTVQSIQNKSTDELVDLYKQGYSLNINPNYQMKNMLEVTPTLSNALLIGGLLVVGFILYYKFLLPMRYKLESDAAKRSGVKYSAVGLTGTGRN